MCTTGDGGLSTGTPGDRGGGEARGCGLPGCGLTILTGDGAGDTGIGETGGVPGGTGDRAVGGLGSGKGERGGANGVLGW